MNDESLIRCPVCWHLNDPNLFDGGATGWEPYRCLNCQAVLDLDECERYDGDDTSSGAPD